MPALRATAKQANALASVTSPHFAFCIPRFALTMPIPTIQYLTNIHLAPGAADLLPNILDDLNVQRPLIVTDPGITDLGLVARLSLPGVPRGLGGPVFDDVEPNPTEANARAGLDVFREHDCDSLVALGGGSPMDCAKAIALLSTHDGPLDQFAIVNGGVERIRPDKPPVVAVPTTAGTGSEVGRGALVTMETGEKLALISPHLIPQAAVCDPTLTLDLPPMLTAATGFDAISHCVETFCSPKVNPTAEAIALDGLARATQHLRTAVEAGDNLDARTEMMIAALHGGMTFQKGLGFIHSLSHPLGALRAKRLHHGTLNAVFLPHVLRFNAPSCADKMQRLAEVLDVADATVLPNYFQALAEDVGLPATLTAMGVTPDDLTGMPEAALRDHCHRTNPREVTLEDCQAAFDAAL